MTSPRRTRARHARSCVLTPLLGAVAALAVLLLAAGGADAVVVKVKTVTGTTTIGEQPASEGLLYGLAENRGKPSEEGSPSAANFSNPEGHAVVEGEQKTAGEPSTSSVNTYLIYWEDGYRSQQGQYSLYSGEWQALIDRYMSDLSGQSETGGNDVFRVDSQYTGVPAVGGTGHATSDTRFLGAYTDTNPYPSSGCTDLFLPKLTKETEENLGEPYEVACLTDAQVRAQLSTFIAEHKLKTGMNTVFFVLTPPRVGVCVNEGVGASNCSQEGGASGGLCSYHSYFEEPGGQKVLYAAIPWVYGDLGGRLLDAGISGIACQDGGWNKNAEKGGPLEQTETPQEVNQLSTLGADGEWDEGVAELTIGQVASEEQNTITDPLLNAWQDREKLKGEEIGYENTDECRDFFLPVEGSYSAKEHTGAGVLANQKIFGDSYYTNNAFNLAAKKLSFPGVECMEGINIAPGFTLPPTVNAGETVGFDGMESDITLNAGEKFNAKSEAERTYATYAWNFGDGSTEVTGYAPGGPPANPPTALCEAPWLAPCAASTFHTYQYGGVYKVVLTVTDVGGNTGTVTHTITVVGPPAPTPPVPPGSTTSGGGAGGGTGSPGAGLGVPTLPVPVAHAAAVSSSLKQVARSGLVVQYSVNEQVTGHFEVLLEAAAARRLKISGPTASGLPVGFPKSVVIGRALLVTVKGGHSSVRIKFSPSVARRLRRAHKVALTLRLVVRNASSHSPLFTTVMSSAVLHR